MNNKFTPSNTEHSEPDDVRELDNEPLQYRTAQFLNKGETRALFIHKETLAPSSAMSIYETHLYTIGQSKNSVKSMFTEMNYLFTWAQKTPDLNLDTLLLNGGRLKPKHIRAFRSWLENRANTQKNDKVPLDTGYRNSILTTCSTVFQFFVSQYAAFDTDTTRDISVANIRLDWKAAKKKQRIKKVADNLTEEEVLAIETTMKIESQIAQGVKQAIAHRNYLMWRLSIEFGMRIGELLLLELQDLPSRDRHNIKIVRVDERGNDFFDPRGTNAPLVKTLSRELGFVIKNSPIPKLLSIYTTKYRNRKIIKHGRKVRQLITDHPFLILEHHRRGAPLSVGSAQDIAKKIANDSGVKRFHWHLSRHSFFNRAYKAIASNEDYKDQKKVLQVYGGWEDIKSMDIYVARARKERAGMTLAFWQQNGNVWESLS